MALSADCDIFHYVFAARYLSCFRLGSGALCGLLREKDCETRDAKGNKSNDHDDFANGTQAWVVGIAGHTAILLS